MIMYSPQNFLKSCLDNLKGIVYSKDYKSGRIIDCNLKDELTDNVQDSRTILDDVILDDISIIINEYDGYSKDDLREREHGRDHKHFSE